MPKGLQLPFLRTAFADYRRPVLLDQSAVQGLQIPESRPMRPVSRLSNTTQLTRKKTSSVRPTQHARKNELCAAHPPPPPEQKRPRPFFRFLFKACRCIRFVYVLL